MEGVELHLWNFADPKAGWPLLWRYTQERDGVFSARQVEQAMERSGEMAPKKKRTASRDESDSQSARNKEERGRVSGR
jgi:curli production assembly/transport component CsgG